MKKRKSLTFVVGILVFLMIFLLGRKAYGTMGNADNADIINIESSKTAEGKAAAEDKEMNETVTGGGTADTVNTAIEGSETAEEKAEAVDKKMNEALASDRYSKMSLEERRELASGILSQLEQDGYITGLLYNEDSFMYSFEYIDGTLGGWCIKDFSAQDGMLPMN